MLLYILILYIDMYIKYIYIYIMHIQGRWNHGGNGSSCPLPCPSYAGAYGGRCPLGMHKSAP